MTFDKHIIAENHFEKNEKICNAYLNNKKEIDKNWDKIKNHKSIDDIIPLKKEEIKLVKNKVIEEYLRLMIIEKGQKSLSNWKIIKNLSFISSILFLVVLYLMFWYISSDFQMIQESFTNLFCVI